MFVDHGHQFGKKDISYRSVNGSYGFYCCRYDFTSSRMDIELSMIDETGVLQEGEMFFKVHCPT